MINFLANQFEDAALRIKVYISAKSLTALHVITITYTAVSMTSP